MAALAANVVTPAAPAAAAAACVGNHSISLIVMVKLGDATGLTGRMMIRT